MEAIVAVRTVKGKGVPSAMRGGRLRNVLSTGVSTLLPPIPKKADKKPVMQPISKASKFIKESSAPRLMHN
jgi:hypothetical protein